MDSMLILRERDYFDAQTEMHYALLQSAESIGPTLHKHQFFEIFLVIDGQIRHFVNGKQMTLRAGSMTFIRPNDAHYYRPKLNQSCQLINLAITRRAIYDLFGYLGCGFQTDQMLASPLPPMVQLTAGMTQQVHRKLAQLHQLSVSDADAKQTALRIVLFELVTKYLSLSKLSVRQSNMPMWLQAACNEMYELDNLAGGVGRMATLSGVSQEHLTRSVRKFLGQTPTAYINQLRMTVAANMLMTTDRPIVEIVADVGFNSLSHFYTLFKQHHNQTPRQFRRQHAPQPF